MGNVWGFVQPYAASAVRHGLTAGAGYLAARGLAGIDDATVNGLTVVAMGGLGMGWSWLQKYTASE